jgi:8-oxo-dGTP diphosphatase
LDEIAIHAFESELNIKIGNKYQEQLYTLSQNNQIQMIYYILVSSNEISNQLLSDFHDVSAIFDSTEKQIIIYAVQRLRWKIEYTNAVYSLLPKEFTFANLQNVYEAILGLTLDKRNFRKKILSLDIIEPTGHMLNIGRARPAEKFKFKKEKLTFVSIL